MLSISKAEKKRGERERKKRKLLVANKNLFYQKYL